MRLTKLLATIGLVAAMAPAYSASLSFRITDGSGQPLTDAVVTMSPESGESAAKTVPREHIVDQKDETFVPVVEVVNVGDTIVFRNSDRTRHHVYTFSPLTSFEYVLKPKEVSAPLPLTKPGIIAVGCNIHDFMVNYLFVTDSRWAAKSDDKGGVTLADMPVGAYVAHYWHPRLRPGAPQPAQKIAVGAENATIAVSLPVLPEHKDDDPNKY